MVEIEPSKYSMYNDPGLYGVTQKANPSRSMFYNGYIRACETHILDLGCGTGDASLYAAQNGISSVGVDSSEPMLDCAKKRLNRAPSRLRGLATFIHSDITSLPRTLLKGTFDTIFCANNTLMHLESEAQLDACFLCVSKALRVGGFFVFDVLNPGSLRIKSDTRPTKTFEDMPVLFKRRTLSRKVWSTYHPQSQKYDHKIAYFGAQSSGEAIPGLAPESVQMLSQYYRYPSQIKLALEFAGLKIVQILGGFEPGLQTFNLQSSERMVIVAALDC